MSALRAPGLLLMRVQSCIGESRTCDERFLREHAGLDYDECIRCIVASATCQA